MILNNITCSDLAYRKLGLSPENVGRFINKYAFAVEEGSIILSPEEAKEIARIVGSFSNGMELIQRIKPFLTLPVLGHEIEVDPVRMRRIVRRAFRHTLPGEPRTPQDASPEALKKIVNRYVENFILADISRSIGQL